MFKDFYFYFALKCLYTTLLKKNPLPTDLSGADTFLALKLISQEKLSQFMQLSEFDKFHFLKE